MFLQNLLNTPKLAVPVVQDRQCQKEFNVENGIGMDQDIAPFSQIANTFSDKNWVLSPQPPGFVSPLPSAYMASQSSPGSAILETIRILS